MLGVFVQLDMLLALMFDNVVSMWGLGCHAFPLHNFEYPSARCVLDDYTTHGCETISAAASMPTRVEESAWSPSSQAMPPIEV